MPHTIEIDAAGTVYIDNAICPSRLTQSEEKILRAIFSHSHVASKDFLLSTMYGGMDEPELKIIDVFVTKVRAKLGVHRDAIRTSWGRGYFGNQDYQVLAATPATIAINIDAVGVEDLSMATGEAPDVLLTRLVSEERRRIWAEAA